MADEQPHATTGPDELSGREAVQWLLRCRGEDGPHLMDTALVAVTEAFGLDARIAAFVPIETPRGRRWRFFLVVDGSPSNDDDWRRLHRAHEVLISREEWLTSVAPNDDPYARFHVVLAPDREDALPIREVTDQAASMKGRELIPIAARLGAGKPPPEAAARSAVSRAYYAAYTEVTEYVTQRGLTSSPSAYSHDRTWNHLKNGIPDKDSWRRVERRSIADQGFLLKTRRQKADYRPNSKLARDESKQAVAEAEDIIKRLDALKP